MSDLMIDVDRKGRDLGKVTNLIIIQAFQVLLIKENLNALFDIWDLGREAAADLVDGLADEELVLHLFARLHDADDCGLCGFR